MDKLLINKNRVLRYLGYKNQNIDEEIDRIIEESIIEIIGLVDIKHTYRFFNIEKSSNSGILVKNTNLVLRGKNIEKHLENSSKCILIAITLGHRIDAKIRYYEKINMTKAIILDACASALIEESINGINEELRTIITKKNKTLTSRYSPGYGDLSIDIQSSFLRVLDAEKIMGLSVNSHNILIPRKSITAIIGIVDKEIEEKNLDCLDCNKYKDCDYSRRDGEDDN